MNSRTSGEALRASSAMSAAGWLFADLLLVLAMLFFAANTMGIHPPSPTPTPVPSKRPVLEHTYCQIILNDGNPDTFRSQLSLAIGTLEPQINAVSFLHGRRVGLAIAYGGIDNIDTRSLGTALAAQTYRVLDDLATHSDVFANTSHFDPLYTEERASDKIVIDVYLIVRSDNSLDTCDAQNHAPKDNDTLNI
jgi:hypothetical protein